jgi:hypothetical protein
MQDYSNSDRINFNFLPNEIIYEFNLNNIPNIFSTDCSSITLNFITESNTNNLPSIGPKKKSIQIKSKIFKVLKPEFKCGMKGCTKIFMKKWVLERHLKAHLSFMEKFCCNVHGCGKIYKQKENLVNHYKNYHLLIKPYKCRFCCCEFRNRNSKLFHERRFHLKCLYKCTYESKIFIYF